MKTCPKCDTTFDARTKFCSRSCANSRTFTEDAKHLKRVAAKKNHASNTYAHLRKYKSCPVCAEAFYGDRITCGSTICKTQHQSNTRVATIERAGSAFHHHDTYVVEYRGFTVEVDSKLEHAAVMWLVDEWNADSISRFNSILRYWDSEVHRRFNPDFMVTAGGKRYVVEVKLPYVSHYKSSYFGTIPFKRLALQNWCKENDFEMLWLDFESYPTLKTYYAQVV